jgi:hypothetical protein
MAGVFAGGKALTRFFDGARAIVGEDRVFTEEVDRAA